MSTVTVGFAGIGRMGLPIARNLAAAGFPMLVWNRTQERCDPLVAQGATSAPEPACLAEADIVVTMLSDGPAVRAALVESGLLDALRPGSVVIEMSTIGPKAVAELEVDAQTRQVELLDAVVAVTNESVAETLRLGVEMPAADAAARVLDEAVRQGLAEADMAHVLADPRKAAENDDTREES